MQGRVGWLRGFWACPATGTQAEGLGSPPLEVVLPGAGLNLSNYCHRCQPALPTHGGNIPWRQRHLPPKRALEHQIEQLQGYITQLSKVVALNANCRWQFTNAVAGGAPSRT